MIQAIMYFVLGLLTAGLIALALTPAIWRRALRLTRARVEADIPVSRSEIAADKDRLRATFAASNRHLEMEIGRLNERTTGQIVEINRARDEITALATEGRRLNLAVEGLEKNVDDLTANLGETDEKLTAANAGLKRSGEELEGKAAALAALHDELAESTQLSEAQRLEIVAHKTEIGNLSDSLAKTTAREADAGRERDRLASELTVEGERLAAETSRVQKLNADVGVLQTERAAAMAETDRRAGAFRATRAELAARQTDLQALEARLREMATNREDLVSELNLVVEDRSALAADLQKKSATLATVQSDLNAERERIKAVDASLAELRAVQLDLEGQRAAADEERAGQMLLIGELRTAFENEQRMRSELMESATALEGSRDELEVRLATATAEDTERQAEFDRLLSELDAAQRKQLAAQEETDALRTASTHDQSALEERTDEVNALNAELFAAVRREEQLEARLIEAETNLADARAENAALAIRNRTDTVTDGDNVRKSLAAVESERAELASKLAALEKDHTALRAENQRIRSGNAFGAVETNDGDEDLHRQLREIADGIVRLTRTTEPGRTPVPSPPASIDVERSARTAAPKPSAIVDRAPPKNTPRDRLAGKPSSGETADENPDGRTLAERLRALQQPVVRP